MNYIDFSNDLDLAAHNGNIVRDIPCYRFEDLESLVLFVKPDIDKGQVFDYITKTFKTTAYACTKPYNENTKKRGPNNSYYVATPALDKFVHDHSFFAMIAGHTKRPLKRYIKDCRINKVGPSHWVPEQSHLYLDIVKI